MQSDLEALRNTRFFAGLPEESLANLAMHVKHRHFDAGDQIFPQGAAGNAMYIVAEGEVKISVETEHKPEITLRLFKPGEAFGELALFDEETRSAAASATVPTRLLYLHRDDFISTIEGEPSAMLAVLSALGETIRRMNERLRWIVTNDANARLARLFLEDLAEYHAIDAKTGHITITRDYTLTELGSLAHMHPTQLETLLQDYMYNYIMARDLDKHLKIIQPDEMRTWL